jgi:hypothetical protein
MTPVTARETAPAGRAAARVGTRAAARWAYGAGIGGIVVSLLFIGFYTQEIQHPGDAPLGTASDVAGVTPLPWMSRPQLIVAGVGAGIGAIAWLILPVWYLFLGQDLARAARRRTDHPPGPTGHAPGPADHPPGRPHLPEGDSDGFINPHA